ncbi:MAG: tetratricopeptide repeat protein, partial [Aureliella sp.]
QAAMNGLITAYRQLDDTPNATQYATRLANHHAAQARVAVDRDEQDPDEVKLHSWLMFVCEATADRWRLAGRTAQAIATLEQGVECVPEQFEMRARMAELLAAEGSLQRGAEVLQQGCQLAPTKAEHWNTLALYCMKSRQLPLAATALEQLVSLQPDNATAYALFAQVQMAPQRNPQQGVEYAQRAVELSPTAGHHYILATALYHVGDLPGAREHLNAAIALEPDNREFREALAKL